jgi:hypothetical protein
MNIAPLTGLRRASNDLLARELLMQSSLNEFENVFLLKGNIELPQESQIFISERPTAVVLFLILNVANDRV